MIIELIAVSLDEIPDRKRRKISTITDLVAKVHIIARLAFIFYLK